MTSRVFVFTSFDESIPKYDDSIHRYLIYGKELCPQTNRSHWQGFIQLKNSWSLSRTMKSLSIVKGHMEKCRDKCPYTNAIEYCKKENDYKEFGTVMTSGCRTDLKEIIDEVKSIPELIENYPQQYCMYRQGIKDCVRFKIEKSIPLIRKQTGVLYWGPTCTGKSYSARQYNPTSWYSVSDIRNLWFDGYNYEDVLILDDYCGEIPITDLLKIMDEYKYMCKVKGGFIQAAWTTVIITSNVQMHQWYPDAKPEQLDALDRRLHINKKFDKIYDG